MRNQSRHFSSLKTVLAGVSQRSVLCPLLIFIYMNGITDYLYHMAGLFVDDTSLIISSNDLELTEHVLNTDLVKL